MISFTIRHLILLFVVGTVLLLYIFNTHTSTAWTRATAASANFFHNKTCHAVAAGGNAFGSSSNNWAALAAPGFQHAQPSCSLVDLPDDPLVREYGQQNIRLSRSYEGSGLRVRRLLQKALRGDNIVIAVVGGSVSAGHSVAEPMTADNYMYRHILRWFQETFPKTDFDLNLDSALPAQTAFYFSFCALETLPEDADLVLVELDINSNLPTPESLDATEALYRTILDMDNKPAMIYLSIFALSFDDMTHGWRHSALISQWMDVPMINIRNFYLPHLMQHPSDIPVVFTNWANDIDKRHINSKAHIAIADMTIAYLREQLCLVQRQAHAELEPQSDIWPKNDIAESLPRLGMLWPWDEKRKILPQKPRCRSITSTKDPLVPIKMEGWQKVDRNDKLSFEATEVGSVITLPFNTSYGFAGLWFWYTKDPSFGAIKCWVDDYTHPDHMRTIQAYDPTADASTFSWTRNMWTDVPPGDHEMHCRLEKGVGGGTTFRISATVTR